MSTNASFATSSINTDRTFAEAIASEYAPKDTSKVVALRKLDRRAKRPARVFAITFGIVAALVAGTGMCLSMGVIGTGTGAAFTFGVVIGVLGLAGMGVNYMLYRRILEAGKKKYAFEIMELAREVAASE